MKQSFCILLLTLLALQACDRDEQSMTNTEQTNADLPFLFQDGFESVNDFSELFTSNGNRWSTTQVVHPNNGENEIDISNNTVSQGDLALRIYSNPGDDILSKVDIEKGGFFAPVGSTVTIQADLYINSTENLEDLFLMDLECCSCWDPTVGDNQCPGIRLKLSGEQNYLSIERGKILGNTISQSTFPFPKNEWVNVVWSMTLSADNNAANSLIINGTEIIDQVGKNLPNNEEFKNEFATHGLAFTLQEPLGYERVQIGATANPTEHGIEMFIDNFELRIE